MRKAVLDANNIVENIIECSDDWEIDGKTLVPAGFARRTDNWTGSKFINPVRDAEELAAANARPMENWKASMQGTDYSMPRYAEDILDGMADKSGVAQITLDRLQAKKDKRGERP